MKIFYSHYLSDPNHPAVQMVQNISDQLRSFGHRVYVYGSELCKLTEAGSLVPMTTENHSPKHQTTGNQPTGKSLKTWLKSRAWFAKAMSRNRRFSEKDRVALKAFQPDIVLTRQDAYCWSVMNEAQKMGIPCVTYADAPVAYETRLFNDAGRWHPPGLVERIERWGLNQSKAIITVSEPARRKLSEYQLPAPITVAPNGVDLNRFPELSREQKLELRRELGVEGKIVIGFQGTFKMFHGIDRLQELMVWTKKFDNVCWVLIGDGPERQRLEEATRDIVDVKFLGRRPAEEMGRLLNAIDIAVAPHSQMQGEFYFCPLKILEYAAAGCATLASKQGDIPRMLANGKGGHIVSNDELTSWCDGLEKLITDTAYRQQLGEQAKRHIFENHSWRNTAIQVESVLCDALGQPKPFRKAMTSQSLDSSTELAEEPVLS